jgi:hypothetical protein
LRRGIATGVPAHAKSPRNSRAHQQQRTLRTAENIDTDVALPRTSGERAR